jgi:hypothetical protein
MKAGPHGAMSLNEIIKSKQDEEKIHGVHFWGYSGVFCHPKATQAFCYESLKNEKESVKLILIETKSPYSSQIGNIIHFSENGSDYKEFKGPVQLSGAQFSFVAKNLRKYNNFCIDDYIVVGGKNNDLPLNKHLKFRVNKAFAKLDKFNERDKENGQKEAKQSVLVADLAEPYCIWLKEF